MRAVLEGVGCAVAEAHSRDEVLVAARTAGADVLLLDAALGCALAELKRDPELFRIAVVLVGEPPDVQSAVDALEQGAHDVLRDDAPAGEIVARVPARGRRPGRSPRASGRGGEPGRCRSSCSAASTSSRRWPTTTSSRAWRTAASRCASCRRC